MNKDNVENGGKYLKKNWRSTLTWRNNVRNKNKKKEIIKLTTVKKSELFLGEEDKKF